MAKRSEFLSWLRRERAARVEADASMLIRELGADAYTEARLMQDRANLVEETRRWRDVALEVARKTGRRWDHAAAAKFDAPMVEFFPAAEALEPK